VGLRYYEGAGAGAIMIGEPVPSEYYKKDFDWNDAVIPIPNGPGEISKLIKCLDKDLIDWIKFEKQASSNPFFDMIGCTGGKIY